MSFWKVTPPTEPMAPVPESESHAVAKDEPDAGHADGCSQTPLQKALIQAALPGPEESVSEVIDEAIRLGMLAGADGRETATGKPLDKDLVRAAECLSSRAVVALRR